jgi:hypothetical protein
MSQEDPSMSRNISFSVVASKPERYGDDCVSFCKHSRNGKKALLRQHQRLAAALLNDQERITEFQVGIDKHGAPTWIMLKLEPTTKPVPRRRCKR